MIALVVRILVILFLVGFVLYIVRRLYEPFSKTGLCLRCNGKGYWLGARGRETCDLCKGSGKSTNKSN